ncbi:Flp pilus assembly protein CpaB [Lentisphaerota bacterium ZTH]|nr:Flp pilus assembly protein CpaB [Lentisphaerota bacterium]WET06862.1 Flp pilus assembly protein CpaB [Lentisphaerota bacterium ZTH]
MRQKLLLLAAVFFGVVAFVLTYQQIQAEKLRIQGQAEYTKVVKLTCDKASGEDLSSEDITSFELKRLRTPGMVYRDIPWSKRNLVIGRKLDVSLDKGRVLQWDDLRPASRTRFGLNAVIKPGFRAISIAVDATSSVTNLVQPEDRVDIVGTFRFPEMRGDKALDTVTMTILQNVRIIATGSSWSKNRQAAGSGRGYSTVTIELLPKEVEMIIFASQKGRLSLSLRNSEESRFEDKLQSVNFKYLERNIQKYNKDRQEKMHHR